MVRFIEPRASDTALLAMQLREEDKVECILATGRVPRATLRNDLLRPPSRAFSVVDDDGTLLAMCGASPSHLPGAGAAWFLATPLVEKHGLSLIKQAPMYLNILSEPYPEGIWAAMWESNEMHLRWAERVGFWPESVTTIHGQPFILIHRGRDHV